MKSPSGAPPQPSPPPASAGGTSGIEEAGSLLNVNEVAALVRVSKMTVYRLIRAGQLPAIQVGKSYRIYPSDLTAYLRAAAVQPTTEDNSQIGFTPPH